MSLNNRTLLSIGIAGALCCTALLGVAMAEDKSKEMSFTRMFPELPPFAPPTDAAREQAKKLGEKDGLIDAKDDLSERWLRLIGQNAPFLKCSPAVVRLHGLSQCGQVVEVELIRRLVVKRRVRSPLVVEREVLL